MTNKLKGILKRGYFYNVWNEKCHIVYRTDEFIVWKSYDIRLKEWVYRAEDMKRFERSATCESVVSAEKRVK